jgi:hypothetical protein
MCVLLLARQPAKVGAKFKKLVRNRCELFTLLQKPNSKQMPRKEAPVLLAMGNHGLGTAVTNALPFGRSSAEKR